jgi:hypothetical protein
MRKLLLIGAIPVIGVSLLVAVNVAQSAGPESFVKRLPDVTDPSAIGLNQAAFVGFDFAANKIMTGFSTGLGQAGKSEVIVTDKTSIQVTLKVQPEPPPGEVFLGPAPGVAFYQVTTRDICLDLNKMSLPFGHVGVENPRCDPEQTATDYIDALTGEGLGSGLGGGGTS